jgi:hypothetical protein
MNLTAQAIEFLEVHDERRPLVRVDAIGVARDQQIRMNVHSLVLASPWSVEGLPPDGAFRYPRRMLKLLTHHLLTTGIITLVTMFVVTCYMEGMQRGLSDLPAFATGALIGTVVSALGHYYIRKRRLRHL